MSLNEKKKKKRTEREGAETIRSPPSPHTCLQVRTTPEDLHEAVPFIKVAIISSTLCLNKLGWIVVVSEASG